MNEHKFITFSIFKFILDDNEFTVEDFSSIKEKIDLKNEINRELISVDRVAKSVFEDRFICFIFKCHEKYPYSDKVLSSEEDSIVEKDNPRSANEMEQTDEFFAVLDSKTQRIYLSNRHQEAHLREFLKKHKIGPYIIKPVLNEKEFIDNISSVKEIVFTVEKENLFAGASTLSKSLSEEIIYGYGGDEATLQIKYKKSRSINNLKEKIAEVVHNRTSYKNITIVGRDTNDFEKVFNLEGVVSRVSIPVNLKPDTKEINTDDLIQGLILRILKYEERE